MNKHYNIGIFDSGIGGISLLKEITKLLPNENILYFGDTKNLPYGEKSKEKIQEISKKSLKFLSINECKAIVVSSDTASVALGELLSKTSGIPIINFFDSAVNLIGKNQYNEIGIIGTAFSTNSNEYQEKILKNNKKIKIKAVACNKLAPMIELGWKKQKNRDIILDDYLSQIPKTSDALLLACAHYSFISSDIQKTFDCEILDPSEECARELYRTLKSLNIFNPQLNKGRLEFFITGEVKTFKDNIDKILGKDSNKVFKVNL